MKKKKILTDFYNGELKQDPEKYEHLGWESREAQFQRFSILTDYVDLTGKRVLDVGCGLGHLVEHINEKEIKDVKYTGLDILPSMVEEAADRHRDHTFVQGDIFMDNLFDLRSFDVIYCSGMFNLNMGNNSDFLRMAVTKFLYLSQETVVFNLLHKDSPNREETYYYFYPDQVIRELEQIPDTFKSIQLVEHYLQNDFTLLLSLQDGPNCKEEN